MHQAIPYRTWHAASTSDSRDLPLSGEIRETNGVDDPDPDPDPSKVVRMVSENAVIIIGTRGCCMCHVVQRLLQGLGVNPSVHEIHEDHEAAVAAHLSGQVGEGGGTVQFPAVFVGGKLFGGLERVMATHISGELVPILKDAGALWL